MDASKMSMGPGVTSHIFNGPEHLIRIRWGLYRGQSVLFPSNPEHYSGGL